MRIGILGSGLMGGKLGTLFAKAGHDVVFSYAHSDAKLQRLAQEAGKKARAGTPRKAAEDADVVLLAVHWSRVDDVLEQAGDLSGKIIISCTLPMSRDDTALVVAHTTSGAEGIARKKRKARVVSAFSTAPSEVLFDVFAKRKRKSRPSMVFCGDDWRAKKVAAGLIRQLGFDPVDVGPLETARFIEPASLLIAKIAYDGDAGPAVAYRFEYLVERER
ncbi:MAG TPA: NADPH-dependent F420 reductase [Gemmatimonadaceae bacterium]